MSTEPPSTDRRPNRLANEKSPYLLQHAYNPVDWYPWGDEAFARARREDKPIFLSIGYSTCHWCHVMERESFESDEIATILNRHYVAIKVDREERPDVDRVYMTAVQALTGSGGWPLSAWLTPALEPFYAGTYFPPRPRQQMPGFADLLLGLSRAWSEQRDKITDSARRVVAALEQASAASGPHRTAGDDCLELAVSQLARGFDPRLGGFGGAPKFPRPTVLGFLLRYHQLTGEQRAKEMALVTLRRMWEGGMNDHLGGGFHRYSVDEYWRVPHFEKMLYDQAQLVWAFLDAHQLTGEPFYADGARQVLTYVARDLTHEQGGFFSAEDADSARDATRPHDKQEGVFYLWEKAEIVELLGESDAEIFNHVYGVSATGNTIHDPHGELGTGNVLYAAHTAAAAARSLGRTEAEIAAIVEQARAKLLAARGGRPRPHLDDKVITAWNGLMISACARASQVLADPTLLEMARRAARMVLERCCFDGELKRRYRQGEAKHPAHLDDYAALATALVDLYEASAELGWLKRAVELTEEMVARFADHEQGGFFDAAAGDDSILVRFKEGYDGAEPAGNSMAALLLLRLSQMLDRADWQELATDTLTAFGDLLARAPQALPHLLTAVAWSRLDPLQIVIAGQPGAAASAQLIAEVNRRFLPAKVLLFADGEAGQRYLAERVPYLNTVVPVDGQPQAYVCRGFHCERPVGDRAALDLLLSGARQSAGSD